MENLNFYILTGGPGSGKSTVLSLLFSMGYSVVPEVGRKIIQEQVSLEGNALPWGDRCRYAELMLLHSVLDFGKFVSLNMPRFFDRGIPDILGYCRFARIPVGKKLESAVRNYRYNPVVFVFPPWETIYTQDPERKQSFQEARDTCYAIREVYEENGYRTVAVPFLSPEKRAVWILNYLSLPSVCTSRLY